MKLNEYLLSDRGGYKLLHPRVAKPSMSPVPRIVQLKDRDSAYLHGKPKQVENNKIMWLLFLPFFVRCLRNAG